MKLAEALIARADLQKRIEQLKLRILRNAKVQEGDNPAENPVDLLKELDSLTAELASLIQRINWTNAQTAFDKKMTIADAIASRDRLSSLHSLYLSLAQAATVTQDRYSRSEVKFKSSVDVKKVQKQADKYAKDHRNLDGAIQSLNWSTDLIE